MKAFQRTVPDLSAIPAELRHFLAAFCVVDCPLHQAKLFVLFVELLKEAVPNLSSFLVGEIGEVDSDMDSRDEAVVEGSNTIITTLDISD